MGQRREDRNRQLNYLFRHQGGKCFICGEPANLDGGGGSGRPEENLSAVRFRLGSSFGAKGRVRPRVMAHRKCAQERSGEIQQSVPIEELWHRSGQKEIEVFSIPETN